MAEEPRYIAQIRYIQLGEPPICYEIDLGENKNKLTVEDIVEIARGAQLGQWGADIDTHHVKISSLITVEDFIEYCQNLRIGIREEEKKRKAEQAEKERKESEACETQKRKKKEEKEIHIARNKKREAGRVGRDTCFELYEVVGRKKVYLESFDSAGDVFSWVLDNRRDCTIAGGGIKGLVIIEWKRKRTT